jgi:hypothetical protein
MLIEQIFDTVAKHLLKQNKKSFIADNDGVCAYRGQDNTMCAVGCLIKDEDYDSVIENVTFPDLYLNMPHIFEHLQINNPKFHMLVVLQNLHDKFPTEYWPARLDIIYHEFVGSKF